VLIRLIEEYSLQDYTLIALGKPLPETGILVSAKTESVPVKTEPVFAEIKTNASGKSGDIQDQKITEQKPKNIELPVYPQGEFKINETRVVFVKQGTSYLSIAQQYNVPLVRIFEFNELPQTEMVEKDRLVYIQRKRKTGNNEFHIVKPGESLHDIAQEEAIRFESLLEYNMLTRNMKPAIGEKLYLKNKASMQPRLALKENYSISNFQNVRH
jgi:LysM repeat protein